jgi:hypothetical protein
MKQGTCRLCLKVTELCRSHIFPEFLHRPLYDERGKALAFFPDRPDKTRKIQSGLWEHLLCLSCEQLLNERYERPISSIWNPEETLAPLRATRAFLASGLPYREYKLFHLSLLWRSDASSLSQFSQVDLGTKHREQIREMLLEGDPRTTSAYPIACSAIESPSGKGLWGDSMIPWPARVRIEGYRAYEFVFGGCSWLYFVTSHGYGLAESAGLKENGDMPIARLPWKRLEERAHWARAKQ